MIGADSRDFQSLTPSQMKILASMLKLREASAYTLSKQIGMSYAIIHDGMRKLLILGFIKAISEVPDDSTNRQKIEYVLTAKGREVAAKADESLRWKYMDNLRNEVRFEFKDNLNIEQKIAELEKSLNEVQESKIRQLETTAKRVPDQLDKYQKASNRMFVIMPFASTFDDVWRGAIERACATEGYSCLRIDQMSLSSFVTTDLEKIIEKADYVIADITGLSPGVMFEVGYALGKGKKIVLLKQRNDPLKAPFDASKLRLISYDNSWSGIEKLYQEIREFLTPKSNKNKEELG